MARRTPPPAAAPPLNERPAATRDSGDASTAFALRAHDVVAFVGGGDMAAAQHSGYLETLLAVKCRGLGVRFRNFGWEGDTVFAQPRDVGFPPLAEQLRRAQVTVIFLQFGRSEALDGTAALSRFVAAYGRLIEVCAVQTPRLVLATPAPYENGGGLLPDLSRRNPELAEYANAIRGLARERRLPLVDVFEELGASRPQSPRLTDNGLQLALAGHAATARAFARQLGFGNLADAVGQPDTSGAWRKETFERVRQAVIAKNRLWFNYWRPQNWAFLGGDRTSQPSSRDYRDPKIRWFPREMEEYLPLIRQAEQRVDELAAEALKE